MTDSIEKTPLEPWEEEARASLDAFAQKNSYLADVGGQEAAAASLAYWDARQGKLTDEQTSVYISQAMAQSRQIGWDVLDQQAAVEAKRGFWGDVWAGFAPSFIGIILLLIIGNFTDTRLTKSGVVVATAIVCTLSAGVIWVCFHFPRSPRWASGAVNFVTRGDWMFLAKSTGSLAMGCLLFAAVCLNLLQRTSRQNADEATRMSAQFNKVDMALAMTLAGRDLEDTHVASLVTDTTGMPWRIPNAKSDSGFYLASAQLPNGKAQLRYAGAAAKSGVIESEVQITGGPTGVRQYVYGRVVAPKPKQPANPRQVLVKVEGTEDVKVLQLPDGALAPAPETLVLAREKNEGVLETIQSVDEVRHALLAQLQVIHTKTTGTVLHGGAVEFVKE